MKRLFLIGLLLCGSLVLIDSAQAGGPFTRRFLFPNAAAFRLNSQVRANNAALRLQAQQQFVAPVVIHPFVVHPQPVFVQPQPFFFAPVPSVRQTIIIGY